MILILFNFSFFIILVSHFRFMTQFVPHLLNIGIAMPLYFATYYLCKEAIVIVNNEDEYAKKKIMPFNQVFLAGSLTGAISSLIQVIVRLFRLQLII